jgi:hypothetical protein
MTISSAMYRALCYADVFSFPLTIEEMKRWAISRGPKVKKNQLQQVVSRGGFHALKDRNVILSQRKKNSEYIIKKMGMATNAARLFSIFPGVLGVFVTGGLAVGNAQKKDDIDFFIITKSGWLWTSRFVLVLISKFLFRYTHKRVRREDATPADANTWCLNLWADETALAIPKQFQTLYTAHEVIQALPLVNKENIADRFLYENRWVSHFLHVPKKPIRFTKKRRENRISWFEQLAFSLQKSAVKNKKTYQRVARFYPKSTGPEVLLEYTKRFNA